MKKLLFFTLLLIAVPSFFVLNIEEEIETKKNIEVEKSNTKTKKSDIKIKVKQEKKNKIIELDLEDYVKGVLAGEMPVYFDSEALKAQAVAARTYALKRINKNNVYDVVDTVMNQVYLDNETLKQNWGSNYQKNIKKINEAVDNTQGEYVDYNGVYADTLFFSTSVGNTENSEEIFGNKISYLRSVSSEWDEEVSPVYEQKYTFTREKFCSKLKMTGCDKIYIDILNETSTGRIKSIKINNKQFTGTGVAYMLGIRSNYFTVTIENNKVVVVTKGFGHGVGMSQYGAQGMAKNGYDYKEILVHYYQGTTIKNLYV